MKRTISISVLAVAAALAVGLGAWATASPESDAGTQSRAYLHNFNLPSSGLALEGYCPVAYFAVNKPVRGKAAFASTYKDVTYYFVSDDAKSAFDGDPEKFIPAYGGWCAFGMNVQDKFPVDPTNFKIVDGRLLVFLRNRNVDARELWIKGDEAEQTRRADAHWKTINR